jgi:addiction module HigA family antidote
MIASEASAKRYAYQPDIAIPPGETLRETIEALGMSQAELAQRTGRTTKNINEIIMGKAAITPDGALQLERVLGVPASFWNNLESNYRDTLARLAEQDRLEQHYDWVQKFPVAAMVKRGVLPAASDRLQTLRNLLDFFGVSSPEAWAEGWKQQRAAFRASPKFQADEGAVATWLRLGELEAQGIQCEPYDRAKFEGALTEARKLTMTPIEKAQSRLVEGCASAGVAVVFVPRLPKVPLHGATRWLTSHKAIIQLSLRFKRHDGLWFTFFHEAAHILRHEKKKTVFLNLDNAGYQEEEEANRFAADWLIPPQDYKRFVATHGRRVSKADVVSFAKFLGIAPGIVVGRLQHEGLIPYSHFKDLTITLRWAA